MRGEPAVLMLEDGRVFEGVSSGAGGTAFGEVVFNTSMSGYQETLTDPSYRGQIVVMTASHIGNYGVNDDDNESGRIQVAAFAARHFPEGFSNPRGIWSLRETLEGASIPAIDGLDTRALVRHIRSRGAMRGAVSSEFADVSNRDLLLSRILDQPVMTGAALALEAGTREPYVFGSSEGPRIAAIDYGIKRNIVRRLAAHGMTGTIFPATVRAEELLEGPELFDGFFLSNGPGDPAALPECVATIQKLLESGKPVFGICLGHQLLGLAIGARTFKLPFGHRGVNQPVRAVSSGIVAITSQNHGFAVDAATLPKNAEETHINLNDGTCEGFRLRGRPVFAVQYHPESAPGPHDSDALFAEFAGAVKRPS